MKNEIDLIDLYKNLVMDPTELTISKWETPNQALKDIQGTQAEIANIAYAFLEVEIDKLNFKDIKSQTIVSITNIEPGVYKIISVIRGTLAGYDGDTFTMSFIMKQGEQ